MLMILKTENSPKRSLECFVCQSDDKFPKILLISKFINYSINFLALKNRLK